MCGINGFNFPKEETIKQMNEITRHRGPDDEGVFVSEHWSLGHNRLSIIDLSSGGHMPMFTEDGQYSIVYNGELYNFQEIKDELVKKGYQFQSKSDTEVILYAFQEWGKDCLQKFNGMFVFAILDTQTEELFIARDRLGIKPLYYYHKDRMFAFSSEMKALFAHDPIKKEINIDAMNEYFRLLYIPAPSTIINDVYKLPAGSYMRVIGETVTIESYWDLTAATELLKDKNLIERDLRSLLVDSVQKRLLSDRPVGVFLSGGIDSSIIAGVMSELSDNVNTFSVGFTEVEEIDKYNNDFNIAKKTAEYFGTNHHEVVLSGEQVLAALKKAVYHMDEPVSNHIQAVNMILAEYTTDHVKVVLGGDGSDELFGGYERYYYSNLIDRVQQVIPQFIRNNRITKFICTQIGKESVYTKFNTKPGVERYLHFFAQKEPILSRFLCPAYNRPEVLKTYFKKEHFPTQSKMNFTSEFMRTDVKTWLVDESLARSDKMSMSAGLEYRVPFLDHRVVKFAQKIPMKFKLGKKGIQFKKIGYHYQGKKILASAMSKYIPQFVLDQQKWGWFSPASKWLRGPLKSFAREVLSKEYCEGTAELFDFEAIEVLLENHIDKKEYALNTLWSLITFQLWYKQIVE